MSPILFRLVRSTVGKPLRNPQNYWMFHQKNPFDRKKFLNEVFTDKAREQHT